MMLLAQILPDPTAMSSIGWVFLCLAAIAAGSNQIDDLVQRRKEKPSARDVEQKSLDSFQAKGDYASVSRLEAVATGLKKDIQSVDSDLQKFKNVIIEHGEERKNHIVGHVESVRKELSEDIKSLNLRLDDLPTKILTMIQHLKIR